MVTSPSQYKSLLEFLFKIGLFEQEETEEACLVIQICIRKWAAPPPRAAEPDVTLRLCTPKVLSGCCPQAGAGGKHRQGGFLSHPCCCTWTSPGSGCCHCCSAQTSRAQVIWPFWTNIWPHLYLQSMYLETSENSQNNFLYPLVNDEKGYGREGRLHTMNFLLLIDKYL